MIVPVEIDGTIHNVFVLKRPGVDTFMKRMSNIYEIVVFTASLAKVNFLLQNEWHIDAHPVTPSLFV